MKKSVKSRVVIGLSALTAGGSVSAAGVNPGLDQVILKLADLDTREQVVQILSRRGVPQSAIDRLITALNSFNCQAALSNDAVELAKLERLGSQLLIHLQPNRLDAIFADVALLGGGPTDSVKVGVGSSPVELRIATDGWVFKKISGLDRNTLYETFRQAAAHDARLPSTQLKAGTVVELSSAKTSGTGNFKSLSLNLTVRLPTAKYALRLNDMPLTAADTPEEMAVITIMTLLTSPHFMEDGRNVRLEFNAVRSVAKSLLISSTLDSRYSGSARASLQRIIEMLPTADYGLGPQLAMLIAAKKQLTDFLTAQSHSAAAGKEGFEYVPRTNVFRPASNQSTDKLTVLTPSRGSSVGASRSRSTSDYYMYDPMTAYYYPWIYYPGYPYPCYGPWYMSQVAMGQSTHANALTSTDYAQYADPAHHQKSNPNPSVFVDGSGAVAVVETWDRDRAAALESQGYGALASGSWRRDVDAASAATASDFDRASTSPSQPITTSGRSSSTVRVEDGAIVTTTGGSGWGSWRSDPDPDPAPRGHAATTTGVDVTTTTTTGYDATTTTTTTGDSTTTTTTGDSTTTTTTGSDF